MHAMQLHACDMQNMHATCKIGDRHASAWMDAARKMLRGYMTCISIRLADWEIFRLEVAVIRLLTSVIFLVKKLWNSIKVIIGHSLRR